MLSMALGALLALQAEALPTEELIRIFRGADEVAATRARKALAGRGDQALLPLAQTRARLKDSSRNEALADLAFQLKSAIQPKEAESTFEKLGTLKMSIDMQDAPVSAVLDYLREISGLNIVLDPAPRRDPAAVSLRKADVPVRRVLDDLFLQSGLDYDQRFGVLFLAAPERLWPAAKKEPSGPPSEEDKKRAREHVAALGAESPEKRDQAAAELRKLGRGVVPLLEEAAESKDAEVAARAAALLDEIRRPPRTWGSIPLAGHWRSQELASLGAAASRKLQTMKIDLAFEDTSPADMLEFIREFTDLKITGGRWAGPITFKVKDLTLGDVLELLTLPHGLDIKIEAGGLEIFQSK